MERDKLLKREIMDMFKVTSETLRHYEKKGLITPYIGENSYRYYGFEEIEKLRKILFFRDIELPLYELGKIEKGEIDKESYKKILDKQKKELKYKIRKLQGVEEKLDKLLSLLTNDIEGVYFFLGEKEKRDYLLIPVELEKMKTIKDYYDFNEKTIKESFYNEKEINLIYDYEKLSLGEFFQVDLGLEVNKSEIDKDKISKYKFYTSERGLYLSVYYLFKRKNFKELKKVKKEIDNYLEKNNLVKVSERVVEREHPELSVFLEEVDSIVEVEIRVEKN